MLTLSSQNHFYDKARKEQKVDLFKATYYQSDQQIQLSHTVNMYQIKIRGRQIVNSLKNEIHLIYVLKKSVFKSDRINFVSRSEVLSAMLIKSQALWVMKDCP
jgi:hypothetical protein